MKPVPYATARSARMAHAYRHGIGYVNVGHLDMPNSPLAVASTCEPLSVAAADSQHFVKPPNGANPLILKWHPTQSEWEPLHPGQGKRVGFSSKYLAAHGWEYLGPVPLGKKQ